MMMKMEFGEWNLKIKKRKLIFEKQSTRSRMTASKIENVDQKLIINYELLRSTYVDDGNDGGDQLEPEHAKRKS